jgi:putative flippase GtrA
VAASPSAQSSKPLAAEAWRFGRSLIVGGWGTLLDFAVLSLGVRWLGLEPSWARVAALCAGSAALFFGSRAFAFRARAGGMLGQATRFVAVEAAGFPLNLLLFNWLLRSWPGVAPEALGMVANFLLFVAYYYPARSLVVFPGKPAARVTEPLVSEPLPAVK